MIFYCSGFVNYFMCSLRPGRFRVRALRYEGQLRWETLPKRQHHSMLCLSSWTELTLQTPHTHTLRVNLCHLTLRETNLSITFSCLTHSSTSFSMDITAGCWSLLWPVVLLSQVCSKTLKAVCRPLAATSANWHSEGNLD